MNQRTFNKEQQTAQWTPIFYDGEFIRATLPYPKQPMLAAIASFKHNPPSETTGFLLWFGFMLIFFSHIKFPLGFDASHADIQIL